MGGGSSSSKFILPEDILDFQRCTECKKYLSCPPTTMYPSGEIMCGRCSKLVTNTPNKGTQSTYNKIAKQVLFPCVNRYEGCTELLEYEKVLDHEKKCEGEHYQCFVCSPGPLSILHLIDHYKKQHPELFLDEPVIRLPFEGRIMGRKYLYCNKQQFFIIRVDNFLRTITAQVFTTLKNSQVKAKMIITETQTENHWQPLYESDQKICPGIKDNYCSFINENTKYFECKFTPMGEYFMCRFVFDVPETITKLND